MSRPGNNWYGLAIFFGIAAGIVAIQFLWRYLRKYHPKTYEWMGSPDWSRLWDRRAESAYLTMKWQFYTFRLIWGLRYSYLNDRRLNLFIWGIRAWYVIMLVAIFSAPSISEH